MKKYYSIDQKMIRVENLYDLLDRANGVISSLHIGTHITMSIVQYYN